MHFLDSEEESVREDPRTQKKNTKKESDRTKNEFELQEAGVMIKFSCKDHYLKYGPSFREAWQICVYVQVLAQDMSEEEEANCCCKSINESSALFLQSVSFSCTFLDACIGIQR
jgi:hypothetical protein